MSPAWFVPAATVALFVTLAGWGATAALCRHRIRTDALTGLGNRAALAARVSRAARRWTWPGGPRFAGLLLIDLDEFKRVNDTYGHRAGDVALVAVADRLRWAAPTGRALLPVRLHGDEFAVWLGVTREPAELETRRTEVVAALASVPVLIEGRTVAVSCSVGWAVTGQYPVLRAMLAAADRRMYAAKSTRRAGTAAALPRQTRRRDTRRAQTARQIQGGIR